MLLFDNSFDCCQIPFSQTFTQMEFKKIFRFKVATSVSNGFYYGKYVRSSKHTVTRITDDS